MIRVVVNGDPHEVPAGTSVSDLIDRLELDRRGIAVAVGEEVVSRSGWDTRLLEAGDRVEILTIAQGG